MNKETKIKDVIPAFNGLFSHILNPIYGNEINPTVLDIDFIAKHGERKISPLTRAFVKNETISDEDLAMLANYLHEKYKAAWRRYGVIHTATYDPQITVNMDEKETTTINGTTLNKLLSNLSNEAKADRTATDDKLFKKLGEVVNSGNQTTKGTDGGNIKTTLEHDLTDTLNLNTTENTTQNLTDTSKLTAEESGNSTRTPNLSTSTETTQNHKSTDETSVSGQNKTTVELNQETEHLPSNQSTQVVTSSSQEVKTEVTPSDKKTTTEEAVAGFGASGYSDTKRTSVTESPSNQVTTTQYPEKTETTTTAGGGYTESLKTNGLGNVTTEQPGTTTNTTHSGNDTTSSLEKITGTESTLNSINKSSTESTTHTGESTLAKTGTETTTHKGNDTTNEVRNLENSQNVDIANTESYNYSEEYKNNTKETSNETSTSSKTDNGEEKRDETITREKTMEGDMGVTATAKLLREEYTFWSSWNYIDSILLDVANELGLSVRRA